LRSEPVCSSRRPKNSTICSYLAATYQEFLSELISDGQTLFSPEYQKFICLNEQQKIKRILFRIVKIIDDKDTIFQKVSWRMRSIKSLVLLLSAVVVVSENSHFTVLHYWV
jgi:hypothetical protein